MGYSFDLDDVVFLRSEAGRDAVAELSALALTTSTRFNDVAAARKLVGERFAAAVGGNGRAAPACAGQTG